MTSNYKRIGDYIELVDERNSNLNISKLLGLSISKEFITSVANIIGTDMKNYKIIRKGQFACSVMQVRRDKKMPVALLKDFDEAIISQAYPVFQVIDENKLLPEYLMMWFARSEFDREACFLAVGGVRGSLEWEDFLNMEFPVPSIVKQQQIVDEYNTVVNRINLNEQLNQKLEETAQALYKHWFVDFEFPVNPQRHPELDSGSHPLGYKSSGGKMVYNEELDKEIPEGWRDDTLGNYIEFNSSNYNSNDTFETICYYDTSSVTNNVFKNPQILNTLNDEIPSRAKRKVKDNDLIYSTIRPNLKHFGLIKNPKENTLVSTGFMVLSSANYLFSGEFLLMLLSNPQVINYLQSKAEMSVSTYPSIKPEDITNLVVSIPFNLNLFQELNNKLSIIFKNIRNNDNENRKLLDLQALLLSKMTKVEIEKENFS